MDELVPRAEVVDVSVARAEAWASNGPLESRVLSKMLLRHQAVDQLRANLKADTDHFVKLCQAKNVQDDLAKYIAALSKPKPAKA